MDKQQYNEEILIRFLLGSLSEEETSRLDELSITNDEFAERLQLVENELVDDYVRGELSGPALDQFNSFYLSSPTRRDKISFAQVFRTAANRTAVAEPAGQQRDNVSKGSSTNGRDSRPGWLRRLFFAPVLQWGLAAVLLGLGVAGVWLTLKNVRLQSDMNQAQSERDALRDRARELEVELAEQKTSVSEQEREMAALRDKLAHLGRVRPPESSKLPSFHPDIVPFVLSPQTRGIGQIVRLPVPAGADNVALQLELESADYAVYRAELKTLSNGQAVWSSSKLRARTRDNRKVLLVSLRTSLLSAEAYRVDVTGITPNGTAEPVSSYIFRAAKP